MRNERGNPNYESVYVSGVVNVGDGGEYSSVKDV